MENQAPLKQELDIVEYARDFGEDMDNTLIDLRHAAESAYWKAHEALSDNAYKSKREQLEAMRKLSQLSGLVMALANAREKSYECKSNS